MNLISEEQLERARQRVDVDASARRVADSIFSGAAPWLEREDELLRDLVPDARVPRSFSVNYVSGCPVHGSGPEGHGGYAQGGWRYDPFVERWRLTCQVGGESYPSNDFEAFYRSGMQDRSLLTGPYPDDGWGWQGPGAVHRHWFIAHCCERLWQTILGGVTVLSQAYLLSGDRAYAHKALVLLECIAGVYPDMDYGRQGMYGREFSPGYTGKILDQISETRTGRTLCAALDAVWDALPADPAFAGSAETVRARLQHGIVDATLEGVYQGLIRGNYGDHQETLLIAALVSGDREQIDRAVRWAVDNTGEATVHKEMHTSFDGYIFRDKAAHAEGMNFALDNLIFREGIGWESSPSYNGGWVPRMARIAALVEPLGVRLWEHPRMRRMFLWPTEMTCLDRFTPAIGDCGGPRGGQVQISTDALRLAYRSTEDPVIGELLRRRPRGFDSFESLLEPVVEPAPNPQVARWISQVTTASRLMGGYGLALLRSGRGRAQCAVSLYYGRAATEHGHFDRLTLEVFAYGGKPIPDHGYGEHAAEGQAPAIWTKNTLPHTTVVVDGRRQDTQAPGRLELFAASRGLSLVQVDAPDTYHSVSEYRRTVALVDAGAQGHYVLDLFRVAGGDQHDYSMHGPESTFSTDGVSWSPTQTEGSLAGPDVPRESIYDDPGLLDFRCKGRSYYTYRGGGYSYLYDVRRATDPGAWVADWSGKDLGLRAHFLPCGEAITAHGDPPRKPGNPRQFTYVLLRNQAEGAHGGGTGDEGDGGAQRGGGSGGGVRQDGAGGGGIRGDLARTGGITSRFAAVLEPYQKTPGVASVEVLEQTGTTLELRVSHRWGADILRHAVNPMGTTFSRTRMDADGRITRVDLFGVGEVAGEGVGSRVRLRIGGGISGRVVAVDPESSTVQIERDRDSQPFRRAALVGAVARFTHERRTAAYTITRVEGSGRRFRVGFDEDTFRIGRLIVTGHNGDGSGVSTRTYLYLANQGYYRGARLVDAGHRQWLPVEDVTLSPHRIGARRDGSIALTGHAELASDFASGKIAYLYDFGPGDTFSVTPQATATASKDGSFRLRGNCRAELAVD